MRRGLCPGGLHDQSPGFGRRSGIVHVDLALQGTDPNLRILKNRIP